MKEIICAWIMKNLLTIYIIYGVCFVLFILVLFWNISSHQKKQLPLGAISYGGKVYHNITIEMPDAITFPRLTVAKDLVIENNTFEGRFSEPETGGVK